MSEDEAVARRLQAEWVALVAAVPCKPASLTLPLTLLTGRMCVA